jgi:hypothetical protein
MWQPSPGKQHAQTFSLRKISLKFIYIFIFLKRSRHLSKPGEEEDPDTCSSLWLSISFVHEGEALKQVEHPSYHQQDLPERWDGRTAASAEQPVKDITKNINSRFESINRATLCLSDSYIKLFIILPVNDQTIKSFNLTTFIILVGHVQVRNLKQFHFKKCVIQ